MLFFALPSTRLSDQVGLNVRRARDKEKTMRILLYNPDNGVTRNFMPHLWMFLLQSLTPAGHEVLLIDGNAQPMDEEGIARYVIEENIGLVGIGAMTRMIAKAYRMADAIRAVGVPVVMGGPHVTEMADEALGRNGGPRHADAVALGEADETWPKIVEDAVRGTLKPIYAPVDDFGQERKPSLKEYPAIPWDTINLKQFNIVPKVFNGTLRKLGAGWGTFRIIPVESGRGCPYGCEFCTVTGFFGDSIRFRTNESVVNELLMLKARAKSELGQIAVFFIDDNFAINIKRTKSLLRDIIAAEAQVHWVAQISANLLRDEELVDLIAAAGGKWIFIGMESIDPANLKDVNKGFNKPGEYAAVLQTTGGPQRFRHHLVYFRYGQRHGGRRGTYAAGNSHLAAGIADFWFAHSVAGDSAIQAAGSRGPPDAAETLAGVHSVRHGAHSAQNDHRGSARRSEIWVGKVLQPRSHRHGAGSGGPQTFGISSQHTDRANLFPRHLFSAARTVCVGEDHFPEPAQHLWRGQRRSRFATRGARRSLAASVVIGPALTVVEARYRVKALTEPRTWRA